jgi:hypothetical protein
MTDKQKDQGVNPPPCPKCGRPMNPGLITVTSGNPAQLADNVEWNPQIGATKTEIEWTAEFPMIIFGGPVAEGFEYVTPEMPRNIRAGDRMFSVIETTKALVSVPAGWTLYSGPEPVSVVTLENAALKYQSVFYRLAGDDEIAPTIWASNDYIIAQVFACRPKEPT